jgi:CRP-like cAMP-binding protein
MYGQLKSTFQLPNSGSSIPDIACSGQLDTLIALEQIGTRLRFSRNQEIYGQGESGGYRWYKVVSGTVRVSKLRQMDGGISVSSALAVTTSASRAAWSAAFRPKPSRMSR